MVSFTDNTLWTSFSTAQGSSVATETFNAYNGFYTNGLTGNAGGIQWTATAPGNLYAGLGYMSTNSPDALLTFNLSPSVQGVGGNFFSTDASFNILTALIGVQLADGSAYVGYASTAADFSGFYSTGAAIASISISVAGALPAGTNFATVDNLSFAVVPTPGALALLGVAGLVGGRRRRS
jgi:MYXO-CTERM domain-containing protein